MIQGSWYFQVGAIIDVKLGESHVDTYKYEPMTSLLTRWENNKKGKHVSTVTTNGFFSPFVLSVDGMLGRAALVVLSQLSRFMADKMEETLSQVREWVNGRTAIAVARYYSRMIRGARPLIPLWEREPDWDPESHANGA